MAIDHGLDAIGAINHVLYVRMSLWDANEVTQVASAANEISDLVQSIFSLGCIKV